MPFAIQHLDDKMGFGKYRDIEIGIVIVKHAAYLEWALSNNVITISDEIRTEIELTAKGEGIPPAWLPEIIY